MGKNQEQRFEWEQRQRLPMQSMPTDDQRAERNLRTVFFEPERIVILRVVAGVSMRIVVPIANYSNVRLSVRFSPDVPLYKVELRHNDPDLCVTLFESQDNEFAAAALSEWAHYFGLEKFEDVNIDAPTCNKDAHEPVHESDRVQPFIATGEPIMRRRGGELAQRRPRLFSRRHTGDITRLGQVLRGHREIIARN